MIGRATGESGDATEVMLVALQLEGKRVLSSTVIEEARPPLLDNANMQ